MNPALEARRNELIELAKIEHGDAPEFYICLCVDAYIREHEPHLLDEEELDNKNNATVVEVKY